ncbi:MAG: hypothetical protein V4673_04680 [Pseudomonadota bacterium]
MTSVHSHDDRLALAARSAHAASLDHLSPRVRAQLAQRRRAALAEHGPSSAPRRWPMFALGSAAALVLAIGLFALRDAGDTVAPSSGEIAATPTGIAPVRTPAQPATVPPAVAPAVAGTDTGADMPEPAVDGILIDDALPAELLAAEFSGTDEATGFDALQESPDFYLWLGSDSAQAHGSELL